MALLWQLRSLCGCYGVYMVVTGSMSSSFPQKLSCMILTGQIYVKVWLWHMATLSSCIFWEQPDLFSIQPFDHFTFTLPGDWCQMCSREPITGALYFLDKNVQPNLPEAREINMEWGWCCEVLCSVQNEPYYTPRWDSNTVNRIRGYFFLPPSISPFHAHLFLYWIEIEIWFGTKSTYIRSIILYVKARTRLKRSLYLNESIQICTRYKLIFNNHNKYWVFWRLWGSHGCKRQYSYYAKSKAAWSFSSIYHSLLCCTQLVLQSSSFPGGRRNPEFLMPAPHEVDSLYSL